MAQSAGKPRSGRNAPTASATTAVENGRIEGAQNMVDLEFLRGLIDAVDQSGIDSLEINRGGTKIRIAKTPPSAPPAAYAAMPAPPAAASAPQPAPAATQAAAPPAGDPSPPVAPQESAAPAANLVDVKSPMVGTYYRGPAPDAPPYIEVGSSVTRGQTLCILEAMKLMNELECEVDGIVRQILVEDADPVEFGQVLFRVEPAGPK
jgi:acetyl-CoA carboxylase biotin carboxyl carrier protein